MQISLYIGCFSYLNTIYYNIRKKCPNFVPKVLMYLPKVKGKYL